MEDVDRNAKFFHKVANNRRKFNAIENIVVVLVVEHELHADESSMKSAIVQFYEKLYHENFPFKPLLERISDSTTNF